MAIKSWKYDRFFAAKSSWSVKILILGMNAIGISTVYSLYFSEHQSSYSRWYKFRQFMKMFSIILLLLMDFAC